MTRSWRTVAPFLVGLVLFLALAAYNQSRGLDLWRNYALSGFFLGAPVVWTFWRFDVRVPGYIQGVIVAALLLHYGGGSLGSADPADRMGLLGMHGVNGAYHVFGWWDNLTHAVGIGAGAMGSAYLLELYQLRRGLAWNGAAVGAIAILAALAAGVGVELYEYLGKTAFQTIDQGGYTNTMVDLQFNILGAVAGTLLAVTLDRTLSWRKIRERWKAVPGQGAPAGASVAGGLLPPAMAGFVAFVTVPSLVTLYLALRFLGQDIAPQDERALYDPALRLLLASAVAALLAAPLGYGMARLMGGRRV